MMTISLGTISLFAKDIWKDAQWLQYSKSKVSIDFKNKLNIKKRKVNVHLIRYLNVSTNPYRLKYVINSDPDGAGDAQTHLRSPLKMLSTQSKAVLGMNAGGFSTQPFFTQQKNLDGVKIKYRAGAPSRLFFWNIASGAQEMSPLTEEVARSNRYSLSGSKPGEYVIQSISEVAHKDPTFLDMLVSHFHVDFVKNQQVVKGLDNIRRSSRSVVAQKGDELLFFVFEKSRGFRSVAPNKKTLSSSLSKLQLFDHSLTLAETAAFLQSLGVEKAMNLDGGGSSVVVGRGGDADTEEEGRLYYSPYLIGARPLPSMLFFIRK